MFIEDEELRELYKVASEDHITKIEQGLITLEKQPDDIDVINELLRETHSLKGDSRMLGVEEAEILVHQMEDILNEVKEDTTLLSAEVCDRLYIGVDAVKKIAQEAITGQPSEVNTFDIVALLMGADAKEESLEESAAAELTDTSSLDGLEDLDWDDFSDDDSIFELTDNPAPEENQPEESQPVELATAAPEEIGADSESCYIEDSELRELYKVASADHLEKIEHGLITLEQDPNDVAMLEELLRATHSLKGDSRMLGVAAAETLVHHIEDVLIDIKENNTVLSSQLCDRLYIGVDAVKKIAHEAVTGIPSGVSTFHIMAELMGAEEDQETSTASEQAITEQATTKQAETLHQNDEPQTSQTIAEDLPDTSIDWTAPDRTSQVEEEIKPVVAPVAAKQIETIRVDFTKLDALMTQAGELVVTKSQLERRNEDIAQLLSLWDEWNRDFSVNQQLLQELAPKLTPEELEKVSLRDQQEQKYLSKFGNLISTLKNVVLDNNARLDTVTSRLEAGIYNLRLLPLSTVFNLFPRMVRDLSRQLGKEIDFTIEGGELNVDKRIIEEIQAPLTHILRNAIDHGIETPAVRIQQQKVPKAKLLLRGSQVDNRIIIEIIDDGRGLDTEKIGASAVKKKVCQPTDLAKMSAQQVQSLIFAPGFSTRSEVSEISGRGVGLDVVRENVEKLKGSVSVASDFGKGCKFQLNFNTTFSSTYVLIVEVNNYPYAIPVDYIEKITQIETKNIFQVDDIPVISWEDKPISVAYLRDILQLKSEDKDNLIKQKNLCIILRIGEKKIGVFADNLTAQQSIILKPLSKLLKRIPNVSGTTILSDGEVCIVLDPKGFFQSSSSASEEISTSLENSKKSINKHILLVEDSLPIRTQVRRILINSGYDVTVAQDGLEGFNTLKSQNNFNAIISDVEMPNLSGLEMTAKIRENSEYNQLPIILVTTLAKESDKRRGAEAGANAYLTKGDFDQTLLLKTLKELI